MGNGTSIFLSNYVNIFKKDDGVYIESYSKGFSMDNFNEVLKKSPEIKITNFSVIRNAILFAPRPPEKFGELKEKVSVEISADEMKAFIILCVQSEELLPNNRLSLVKFIIEALGKSKVVYGIKQDILIGHLANDMKILIAEGLLPEPGDDSKITMYELKEQTPEVKEDGKVDFYELKLINKVKSGEWLGERLNPTAGSPGKTVTGKAIAPTLGRVFPLIYDRNSAREVEEKNKTVLYAVRDGAVHYQDDKLFISNHLELTDNVDFKTGNIDFDGYLTLKGSIEDNFSVVANKDVEILGVYGVGSVKEIESREGSVYIKGGIAGKNKAVVRSKRNIYTKFISDATVICEGSVHIGYYCMNSTVIAKEVIIDSSKGQIIGGNIQAEIKVVSSVIGSAGEKRTAITVTGFDRKALKMEFDKNEIELENLRNELFKIKQELNIYSNTQKLTPEHFRSFEILQTEYMKIKESLKRLEEDKRNLVNYIRTHGEGEVAVLKSIHPNTVLTIKKTIKEIDKIIHCATFYFSENDIKQI